MVVTPAVPDDRGVVLVLVVLVVLTVCETMG